MKPEDRLRLEQRRRELQEEIALRKRRKSVRERTAILDAHGASYELLFDDQAQVEWVWEHFPGTGGLLSPRIDWARVAVHERGPGPDAHEAEEAAWLTRLAAIHDLEDREIVMLTGNQLNPAIRTTLGQLIAHPRAASCGSDLWIVCEAGGWAIEFLRFEEGWCWGRASPSGSCP